MKISRSDRRKAVFVLHWSDVKRLWDKLAENFPEVSVKAQCVDKLERSFSSISELRNYQNSLTSAIKGLTFVAVGQSYSQRVVVSFANDTSGNVQLSLDADEVSALAINDFYEGYLDSIRPWYSWAARASWYFLSLVVYLLFSLRPVWVAIYRDVAISFNFSSENLMPKNFGQLLAGVLPAGVCIFMESIRLKFFPMGTFSFGDGLARNRRNEVIRSVLIAGLGISILSSTIWSFSG
jgi:hypothetical protein